jgi:hypothetical protein
MQPGVGVYDCRCAQHSSHVRSDAGMGSLTHVGISEVVEDELRHICDLLGDG